MKVKSDVLERSRGNVLLEVVAAQRVTGLRVNNFVFTAPAEGEGLLVASKRGFD
jgi:hypothetical protein